jgi:hypothetical protein
MDGAGAAESVRICWTARPVARRVALHMVPDMAVRKDAMASGVEW